MAATGAANRRLNRRQRGLLGPRGVPRVAGHTAQNPARAFGQSDQIGVVNLEAGRVFEAFSCDSRDAQDAPFAGRGTNKREKTRIHYMSSSPKRSVHIQHFTEYGPIVARLVADACLFLIGSIVSDELFPKLIFSNREQELPHGIREGEGAQKVAVERKSAQDKSNE